MTDDKHAEQAADDNRAPGQETPSRGYGRQTHADDSPETSEVTPTNGNGQASGDKQQKTGSPSE